MKGRDNENKSNNNIICYIYFSLKYLKRNWVTTFNIRILKKNCFNC